MASSKQNKKASKKELSEGKAIALSVLVLAIAIIAGYYILKYILEFFLPGF